MVTSRKKSDGRFANKPKERRARKPAMVERGGTGIEAPAPADAGAEVAVLAPPAEITQSFPRQDPEGSPAHNLHPTLREFVDAAWKLLEPVARLQWNWHLDLICEYLTLIRDQQFQDNCHGLEGVIFNVPPRTMKSLLISVFFPAWVWTQHPSRRFMFVSYSEKLSTQHSVYRRTVMESDWYQERWGTVFSFAKDQNLKSHYENSARGIMFSTGMQATATGMGGDILIFDDPLNPEQALSETEREAVNLRFDSTFRSRINDPGTGVKIVIMQRLHELDLTGHILRKEAARWKHISLPAIAQKDETFTFPAGREHKFRSGDLLWPARLPQSFLDGQKIGMGSWAFNGQYQQEPAPMEGGIIKRRWVRFYRELPAAFDFLVQSWDCTFTGSHGSDFVAGQVWGRAGGCYYMLPYRTYERLDFAPTKAAIKSCCALFPHADAVLIEDKANGPAIISELQKDIPGIVAVSPDGGKLSRAHAMAPLWEAGSIQLPDPHIFGLPWMESYIHNICTFPRAAHDDDVDATSQALIYMRNRLGEGIMEFYRRQSETPSGSPPAQKASVPLPSGPLVLEIHQALRNSSLIQCSPRQYPEIRRILDGAAATWTDPEDFKAQSFACSELERLDRIFGFSHLGSQQ